MEFFQTILTALASISVLFILSKLMGNREMSQLSMFDYINGITIGSIAAEMATSPFSDALKPLIIMFVYTFINILLVLVTNKSIKLRRILTGKPTVIYDKGKLYYKNLARSKMDVNEFLSQCRISGYFDLSNLQTALLECNGKLSFLPISDQRPLMPKDLNLTPVQENLVANIILDGKLLKENLKNIGNTEDWLYQQLQAHYIDDISEIFLATCDGHNQLCIYKKINEFMNIDILK